MGDVWAGFADIAAHFSHYTDVIIAVEEVVLVLTRARPTARTV